MSESKTFSPIEAKIEIRVVSEKLVIDSFRVVAIEELWYHKKLFFCFSVEIVLIKVDFKQF